MLVLNRVKFDCESYDSTAAEVISSSTYSGFGQPDLAPHAL